MSADLSLARAEALIELDRHAEALPLIERAVAGAPEDPELLDVLAQAQLEVDPPAAARTAEQLIGLLPDSYRGPLLASLAYDRLGRGRDATRTARAAVELAPWLPLAHAQLAQALVGRRWKYREAMREAQQAIVLSPDESLGYVTAGNVDLGIGRLRRANRWYEQALEVDPHSRPAQHNVALTNKVRGRLGESLRNVHAILRLDPRDEGARELLDDVVYTTLVHLQWVALVLAFVVAMLKGS